jgi:hypothetical protein
VMKATIGLLTLFTLAPGLLAQSLVKATLAYSRDTTSVVPAKETSGSAERAAVKTDYLIYVVLAKGTIASATGACVEGKLFASSLQKVDSPVVVARDPAAPSGPKKTLVGATDDDVYQVELGEPQHAHPLCFRAKEGGPPDGSAVAVLMRLGSGAAGWNAVVDRIVPLPPIVGP